MPDREPIHKLVDRLPEDALEAAERLLQSCQTWRPEPPLDVPGMRASVKERFARAPDEHVMEQIEGTLARRRDDGDLKHSLLFTHTVRRREWPPKARP